MRTTPLAIEALIEQQAAIRRVATLVATEVDSQHLFDSVCEELAAVLGVDCSDVVRFEGDGTATVVGGWAAPGAPQFPVGMSIPIDAETVTGKLYATARPQRVDDYSSIDGELAERLRAYGFQSVVGAPIFVAGRLWGGLMASSAVANVFADTTEEQIADFAELVTAALANADAREQLAASCARVVEAGYEERRRLERDLHDGAQQELVRAVMTLKAAEQRLSPEDDGARELVGAAFEQVQAGLRDLRELAQGIHPSVLTDRGLRPAIEVLATRSPILVEIGEVPEERLPASVETTAYFVVAEALTNVAKHAHCEVAAVSVRQVGEAVIVEVRDDGVGGADAAVGSGLRGLRDRVGALGGTLDIDSPPGRGTVVAAKLSLRSPGAGNTR
jgi:signal transduction histidine kinase